MYFIILTGLLLTSYIGLLVFEARRGSRLFAARRNELDRLVHQSVFIISHVDFASFVRAETERIVRRLTHDLAHLSLLSVRAIERLLTQVVRRLRAHGVVEVVPRESARHFVRTLSEFKGHLETTRPEVSELK